MSSNKVGVWLFGALGGLATTVVVGARAIARECMNQTGLVSARPEFAHMDLVPLADLRFGGHEIRAGSLVESAAEIQAQNGSLGEKVLEEVAADLHAISEEIRPGTTTGSGVAIERLANTHVTPSSVTPRAFVEQVQESLATFRQRQGLDRLIAVNLTSTEPVPGDPDIYASLAAFEKALDRSDPTNLRPSALYAYAALREGAAYVNFTPSAAALSPAIRELGNSMGRPYMGNDGKTGETLVKSALAPMFRFRNLDVMSWHGYNLLGDRDGLVLAEPENKDAKVRSKDGIIPAILGRPVHTHVGIDFVESLGDLKTAWDFIHFRGFLDFKMSLQFTWQGCDAILAAPLVLDLVRFAEFALRQGEQGPMTHLGAFFKSPFGVDRHALHEQDAVLLQYAERHAADRASQ